MNGSVSPGTHHRRVVGLLIVMSDHPRIRREAPRSSNAHHHLSVVAAGRQELPSRVWDTTRTQQENK